MEEVGFRDTKLPYLTTTQARKMDGLRIVLDGIAVPGSYREACKSIFQIKGLDFVAVDTLGDDGTQDELYEWTAQRSAPVVIYNDEPPKSTWLEQIYLAERLAPEPSLVPQDPEQRIRMIGLISELVTQTLWPRRALIIHEELTNEQPRDDRAYWEALDKKYPHASTDARFAVDRMANTWRLFDSELAKQQARGSRYLIGDRLSALDIYMATTLAAFVPLPHDLCPMSSHLRALYETPPARVAEAISQRVRDHRLFIYEEHLELPIIF